MSYSFFIPVGLAACLMFASNVSYVYFKVFNAAFICSFLALVTSYAASITYISASDTIVTVTGIAIVFATFAAAFAFIFDVFTALYNADVCDNKETRIHIYLYVYATISIIFYISSATAVVATLA